MKRCPACRSQYTDDTLQFCLQDGTPLQTVAAESSEGTWQPAPPEEETIVSERSSRPYPPVPTPGNVVPARTKSRTGLLIFASALGTLLLVGILAAGYLISRRAQQNARSGSNINVNVSRTPEPAQSPSPTPSPSPTSNAANANSEASPTPDAAEMSREVTRAIADWQNDTESLDIDNLVDRYTDPVDYYRTPGASREFVRRDKERAFSLYDSVNFDISNIRISPGSTPNTAVAEFDKAWEFDGENHSEGKVRTRLTLSKVEDRWLISGERDLKVY